MTFREKPINKLYAFALAALFALTLAGCGGGGGGTTATPDPEPQPMPTAYEQAVAAIAAAETEEAAQAAYDAVDQAAITGAESQKLQAALADKLDMLATAMRAAEQKEALSMAAGNIDTSDLSTQEAVDAARTAIAGLRQALADAEDVSEEDKAMYMSQLDDAVAAVDEAQGGIDTDTRRTNQMAALTSASGTLQAALAALAGSTPTKAQLDAANAALTGLNAAIADAADLTDAEKATYMREATNAAAPIQTAQAAFDKAKTAADEQRMKDMAKTGKDLHAALAGNATADTTALNNAAAVSLSSAGLAVDAAAGAGTLATATDPASVTLKAGDSAGALGSWNGMDYAHTNTGTKVVNEARVYTNKGPGKTVSFANRGNNLATANAGTVPAFTAIKGYLTVTEAGVVDNDANLARVMAPAFTHSGTQNHATGGDTGIFTTRGTYDGAPGVYRCTGDCSSTNNDGKGSPSALGGTWHFKPDAGANAMAHSPDATYLYYGWWVSKDKDGVPTAASAFTGIVGDDATALQGGATALATNPNELGGSATYVGHAAGKFAMSNPLDGTGSGGHFTADATLTAKFAANENDGGLSGTIDNFMANGESVPWSVTLHRAPWGTTNGAFATPDDDTATTNVDESEGTTWSINGNSAPRSGTWSGQMYDELPGNAPPSGDGSNVPTTATGTFYSEFSTIGRMVGAFGANKRP